MTRSPPTEDILQRVYDDLDLVSGALVQTLVDSSWKDWEAQGEWLTLAARMGAERVFFVGDEPVLLFMRLPPAALEEQVLAAYRRAWSIARPRCLFIATPDELRVYSLSSPPTRPGDATERLTPTEVVTRAADVAEALAAYHRERIESGALFDDVGHRDRRGTADKQLLFDIETSTEALIDTGLERRIAHALIERVILVRYLEDRGVVRPEYFHRIAKASAEWRVVLQRSAKSTLPPTSTFASVLSNKSFTYAVFRELARDFNGDLFLVLPEEEPRVLRKHLLLIQALLSGSGVGPQQPLFLWAYDFSVVPTSLISSMYEQFYRSGSTDESSTHYTPAQLVEYVLSETLTEDVLNGGPRICDPACGSGIFLVEAFHRIVRHEMTSTRGQPTPARLRELLLTRIAGVDVNSEAIRLAAFSLYLAYLHYQTPQDIVAAGPLPRLIHRGGNEQESGCLIVADAFSEMADESSNAATIPWPSHSFDVVVGNPPWSEPTRGTHTQGDKWALRRNLPVGDRSLSQLFLWRALDLMRENAVASLLVGATAIHNSRETSRSFRRRWLESVHLDGVVNFTSVRRVFFSSSSAPFFLLRFRRHANGSAGTPFHYVTMRPSRVLTASESVAFAHVDRRWVDQRALIRRDYLWKTYAWGNHHDAAFLARLDMEKSLAEFLPEDPKPGYGYQFGQQRPSKRLKSLRSLRSFKPWGPLDMSEFESSPKGVKRQPDERLYDGQRIVIARGVRTGFGPVARLEREPFSFRHTIYCLPLMSVPNWQAKTILGVLLSSLGRYRIFMTSGSWGIWHDSVVPDDLLSLPMRFGHGSTDPVIRRIVKSVDALPDLFPSPSSAKDEPARQLLNELDAAVFELFDLGPAERDLVTDFHHFILDLVSHGARSTALEELDVRGKENGTVLSKEARPLSAYLAAFLATWNRELATDEEFTWRMVSSRRASMIGVLFETTIRGSRTLPLDDSSVWSDLLDRLGASIARPLSGIIRSDGVLRSVGDTSIVIIKRNERRLWTASAARIDAEATKLQALAIAQSS